VLATKAQTENRGNSWQLSDAQLDDQRPRKNALLSPGARPELRIPHAAAQTRIVSVARIWLVSRKSVRLFQAIFCDDISEFESYMPSHAVWSLWDMSRLQNYVPEGPSASGLSARHRALKLSM
jgi:hypothetical protein